MSFHFVRLNTVVMLLSLLLLPSSSLSLSSSVFKPYFICSPYMQLAYMFSSSTYAKESI